VNEIMVNVAWHHDKIEQYFGDGHRWGVQIGYSYEGVRDHGDIVPKPMGSAGGMRKHPGLQRLFRRPPRSCCVATR
jgi:mannose-1-phosphate guanylyltransferase